MATLSINYGYDALGNLTRDDAAQIEAIEWTVAGKVKAVESSSTDPLRSLTFGYGASGQRIVKQVGPDPNGGTGYREHYIRDAQGNLMATYKFANPVGAGISLRLMDRPIYGSSRLGSYARGAEMYGDDLLQVPTALPMRSTAPMLAAATHYELTDHLGNVTTLITGRLLDGNGGGTLKQAEVLSAQGFEVFGLGLTGRVFHSERGVNGFNGMRKDDEIRDGVGTSYDFGARLYDPRVSRWLSLDPLARKYPGFSPYVFVANNPLLFIDYDGKDYGVYINHTTKTIIIKQTIYSAKEHSAEASSAAMSWNNLSGKFEYVVGSGDQAVIYSVSFELSVTETESWSDRDEAYFEDKSGEANTYRNVHSGTLGGDKGQAATNPALGRGKSEIGVEEGMHTVWGTGTHEIGYTLGIGHWFKGLMKRGAYRAQNETQITLGMVSKVLTNAGIGTQITKGMDYEKEPNDGKADTVIHGAGEAPVNFEKGKVREKAE